ncbi:MAG: hypothetical protein J6S04_02135 [Clostridia bacterium]|nr:hypothetical protein [Clostridia bacterium]
MMKKILSFLAMIAVIGGSMMSTTSCFGGGKNSGSEYIAQEEKVLMGTTGAKIALARERLDENVFSEEMSFWGTEESKAATSGRMAETATARLARQRAKATASQQACTVVGDKVRWTQFDNNSLTMENFENVFNEIELDASQVAESIGRIKKYVGVTDKWIGGDQLLLVEENREILVEKFHFEDANSFGYQVANRYTREDAKNIYDIYSTWSERGESGETRMKYIPGEYYESSYVHSSGFSDYFMAENSSGYWKLSRFGHIREDEYAKQNYIENYVIKDGLGIGMLYNNIEEKDRESRTIIEYDFFDTTTVQSLFGATEQRAGNFSIFNYVGNVENGFAYVEADLSDTRADGDIYMNSRGLAGRLVFDGDKLGEDTEAVHVEGVDVTYDYMHEKYYGKTHMSVNADSLVEAVQKTDEYWKSNGATLKTELSSFSDAVSYVQSLSASFEDTFEWNGYKVAKFEEHEKGQAALEAFFAEGQATYNKVKDNETVVAKQEEIAATSFATVDVLDTAQCAYAGGKITLNNAALTISDKTFLEAGGKYVLKLGLALKGEDGLQSVNMVTLDTASETETVYTEDMETFTVTQNGGYTVPANLAEGNYAVVAYVATADEGIRVSELKEVTFGQVTEGEVASTAMVVDVKKANGGLTVHYGVKLSVQAEIRAQESYTADDIEKALTRAVITYGYPKPNEVVTTEDGEALTADTVITAGTYKIKFLMHTEDGMAEAYAYVTVE